MNKSTTFNLEDLLQDVRLEKTASEKVEEKAPEATDEVQEKKEEKSEEKVASEEPKVEEKEPLKDLEKVAEKLASLESEAVLKEAEMIGKAIMDGAIARATEFEKAASEELSQEKIAELYQNDEEFRKSFDQGYMDKLAEEIEKNPELKKTYQEAYEKTASAIIKIGSYMQDKGYVETSKVITKVKAGMK